DCEEEKAGFCRSVWNGFTKAGIEAFDSNHYMTTSTKLALSFGAAVATARFLPAAGTLGMLARATSTAMGLSFASELIKTTRNAIEGSFSDGRHAGERLGAFALDTLLMTAAGIGGHKFGRKAFTLEATGC